MEEAAREDQEEGGGKQEWCVYGGGVGEWINSLWKKTAKPRAVPSSLG